jgi:DNA-binding NtrC family response regulator
MSKGVHMMKARILVVDDMELWQDIIRDALEEDYHVETAASLEETLTLLNNSEPYQVVVTDIGLSKEETNTDGIDVLKAVHKLSPTTRAIAVSGRAATADRKRFEEEYHALVYLERDVLYDDMDAFVEWVARGVALAESEEKE